MTRITMRRKAVEEATCQLKLTEHAALLTQHGESGHQLAP
jgi:hypothetical protein